MINIKIKTQDVELTDEIREYLETRLKALEKFIPEGKQALCEVELAHRRGHENADNEHYAEINLSVDGNLYRATGEERWLHNAIDKAKDELIQQLGKNKRKETSLLRRGARAIKKFLRRE